MICQVAKCGTQSFEEWEFDLTELELIIRFYICVDHMRELTGAGILKRERFEEEP